MPLLASLSKGGLEALKQLNFRRPVSELEAHQTTLEAQFKANPPKTINEAIERIEQLTGIRRSPTQVKKYLSSTLHMDYGDTGFECKAPYPFFE